MYKRRVFTIDSTYFPIARMREIVNYLHDHDQKFSQCLLYCCIFFLAPNNVLQFS
jgi:hypothetical protein